MKLRLVRKDEIYFKNQDGLRKSENDLNEKAIMPKVLSYVAHEIDMRKGIPDIKIVITVTGFKYVLSNDVPEYRLFETWDLSFLGATPVSKSS